MDKKNQLYICVIKKNKDFQSVQTLICNKRDFNNLVTHIDDSKYSILDIKIIDAPISHKIKMSSIYDYVVKTKNLEIGKKLK